MFWYDIYDNAGELPELRAKEKEIAKDLDDHILTDGSAKKMTVNALFDYYIETKELAENTRSNYIKMWNNHVRDGFKMRRADRSDMGGCGHGEQGAFRKSSADL